MSKPLNNRVYGLIGIGARMANWNADFSGNPKSNADGEIFGSDKALKYSMKNLWKNEGKNVLYYKTMKTTATKKSEDISLRDLQETYEALFQEPLSDNELETTKQLFKAIDVLNFGCTFATKKANIGITGAVQIGQGMNLYEDTDVITQDILSPFPSGEGKKQSSIGKKLTVDEAHYLYPFSINPNYYKEYIDMLPEFSGYTVEAYEAFKEVALLSATALNTNSKSGCQNEFALFVTVKENLPLYLPHLDQYVTLEKRDGKNFYNLTALQSLLKTMSDSIEKIEIYVDSYAIGLDDSILSDENIQVYNIYTKETLVS